MGEEGRARGWRRGPERREDKGFGDREGWPEALGRRGGDRGLKLAIALEFVGRVGGWNEKSRGGGWKWSGFVDRWQ